MNDILWLCGWVLGIGLCCWFEHRLKLYKQAIFSMYILGIGFSVLTFMTEELGWGRWIVGIFGGIAIIGFVQKYARRYRGDNLAQ